MSYSVAIAQGVRTIVAIDEFSVAQNEITFLFGESGIGKSMLCKAVYGLLDPDDLAITINGQGYRDYGADPATSAIKLSSFFVFQEPSSHLNPHLRISDQLREGSLALSNNEAEVLGSLWKDVTTEKVQSVLSVYPKPYRPSGGEKQRVLLAMAFKKLSLLSKSGGVRTFFVFDEPTGSLDNNYRNLFLDYLYEQYELQPFTAMIITHDYSIISEIFSRHRAFARKTHFKELTRLDGGRVALNDFSTDDYLSWLKTTAVKKTAPSAKEPVLEVAARFSIFGREHGIWKDAAHTKPAPLVIRGGDMVYVKAPSGVGKTSLAKIVMGLYAADKVSMTLCGLKISEKTPKGVWEKEIWGKRAGMVFQHADEALDLEATVTETFKGLPLKQNLTKETLKTHLQELFEGEISDSFLRKKVKFLSGGQKQRLNLLRTIMLQPDLIILDEPLNGLDFDSVRKVIGLIDTLRLRGRALLMISHNEEIFDALVGEDHIFYLS